MDLRAGRWTLGQRDGHWKKMVDIETGRWGQGHQHKEFHLWLLPAAKERS